MTCLGLFRYKNNHIKSYKILSRIQINEVRQQLLLKLEEKAEADEDAPLFEESGIRYNRFHLSCSDAESYA